MSLPSNGNPCRDPRGKNQMANGKAAICTHEQARVLDVKKERK